MTYQVHIIDYNGERAIVCSSLDQALKVVDGERGPTLGWKKVELRVGGQPHVYWSTVPGGGWRRTMVRTPRRVAAKTVLERNGRRRRP